MALPPRIDSLPERTRELVRMLTVSLADKALRADASLQDAVDLVWEHPQVLAGLSGLLYVLEHRVDHLHEPLAPHPDSPLQIHAQYSRIEILTAMGVKAGLGRVVAWRASVYEVKEDKADLLTITLDTSSGGFSSTTRYRDFAISPTLIHWESQATTGENSSTGLRYRNQESLRQSILLFARMKADARAFRFLGPARYLGHGAERPMAITWELAVPLPGDGFTSFAAAVV